MLPGRELSLFGDLSRGKRHDGQKQSPRANASDAESTAGFEKKQGELSMMAPPYSRGNLRPKSKNPGHV